MNSPNLNLPGHQQGFSLQEILCALAVVSILASLGIQAISDTICQSRQSKLSSDIQTLNRAVVLYIANGGSLQDLQTIDEVLNKLKTRQTDSEGLKHPGFTGSLIDKRLTGSPLTKDAAKTDRARVIWDRDSQRFTIVNEGAGGCVEFRLDASLASVDFGTEARSNTSIDFDHRKPSWIWSYEDRQPDQIPGPSRIPTHQSDEPEASRPRRVKPPVDTSEDETGAGPSRPGGIAIAALNGRADSSGGGIAIATGGAEATSNGGIAVGTHVAGVAINDGVAATTPLLAMSLNSDDGLQLSRDTSSGDAASGDSSVVTGNQAQFEGASASGSAAAAAAVTGDATANGTALAAALSATGYTRADGDGVTLANTLTEPASDTRDWTFTSTESRCRQNLRKALTQSQ